MEKLTNREQLEKELQEFLGAKYVIITDSCTTGIDALFTSCAVVQNVHKDVVHIPNYNYCSVRQALATRIHALNKQLDLDWKLHLQEKDWTNRYRIMCGRIGFADSAHNFEKESHRKSVHHFYFKYKKYKPLYRYIGTAYSFGWKKPFSSNGFKGGCVATDCKETAEFIRCFVNDGRVDAPQTKPQLYKGIPIGTHGQATEQMCEIYLKEFREFVKKYPKGKKNPKPKYPKIEENDSIFKLG